MRPFIYIAIFFLLLLAPLLAGLHSPQAAGPPPPPAGTPTITIVTPNSIDIQNEFRWAFRQWHKAQYGTEADIDYRSPGGTNDVKLLLQHTYDAFRTNGKLPPEDAMPDIGLQMAWGGGDVFFNQLKTMGVLQPVDFDPGFLTEVFPSPTLGGVNLYDYSKDKSGKVLPPQWFGGCLSSFGIAFNPELYNAMDLPPPSAWSDLSNPRLYGYLALADPTHSGSAAVAYMMVVQHAMAQAESELLATNPKAKTDSPTQYQAALDQGWKIGMGRLLLIGANARYFTDQSPAVPNDVASGDAAAGIAIDFYARSTEEIVGSNREKFVAPPGATAITPDPIAILYGTRGQQLELAKHFIEFLLSPQGQKLWILKVGEPGGPRQRVLHRAPIRQSVYPPQSGWADDANYFATAGGFNERSEWMGMMSDMTTIWAASMIDSLDDLQAAYHAILNVSDQSRRAALLVELADLPITRPQLNQFTADRKRVEADPSQDADLWKAQQRMDWAAKFRQRYHQIQREAQGQ